MRQILIGRRDTPIELKRSQSIKKEKVFSSIISIISHSESSGKTPETSRSIRRDAKQ